MCKLSKIAAIAIITTFLMSLPLTILATQPQIIKIEFKLEYDQSYAKPDSPPGLSKPPKDNTDEVYKIWFKRYEVSYIPLDMAVYTDNQEGMTSGFVMSTIESATEEWNSHTSTDIIGTIYDGMTGDIRHPYTTGNGENAISFEELYGSSTIAMATVWYNRRTRQMVECDILFNTYYEWGDSDIEETPVMDLLNIATHELGHCFNLADIYDTDQNHLTMYGYSGEDDIQKRDLADGDIAGIQAVFGS